MTELFAQADTAILVGVVRFVVCLILIAVQWYVLRAAMRMIRSLALESRREKLLAYPAFAFILLINIPLVIFMVEGFIRPRGLLFFAPPAGLEPLVRPLAYAFFVWTFGSLIFALFAPVVMAMFAAAQFFKRRRVPSDGTSTVEAFDFSRRRFLQAALAGAAAMPFAISAYGAVAARFRKVVERVVVPISGLPPELDGLTIAQLSDIHSGLFMTEAQMSGYVRVANELRPDIIALTGDFVATSNNQVPAFLRAISTLDAKYGVYGCLGNHDLFTDSERAIERGFQDAGYKLLRNRNDVIEVGGARLNIVGVDYIGSRFKTRSLAEALDGIALDGTTVLLMHSPKLFPEAAKAGIHLTLSGHTHGGQITLNFGDFILTPVRFDTMFIAGLFKIGDSHLYVNRGLGTTGPPIRINAPPEITHITLKSV